MVEDLGMTGIQYNIALSLFFIPYILLEGMSDLGTIEINAKGYADDMILESPMQHPLEEVQTTIDIHRHPGRLVGHCHDFHWHRKELHRLGHLSHLLRHR
jgi:hypothetical protein